LRRSRATIVAVEKEYYIFWVCVCTVSYPARRAHAPFYIAVCVLFSLSYYLM